MASLIKRLNRRLEMTEERMLQDKESFHPDEIEARRQAYLNGGRPDLTVKEAKENKITRYYVVKFSDERLYPNIAERKWFTKRKLVDPVALAHELDCWNGDWLDSLPLPPEGAEQLARGLAEAAAEKAWKKHEKTCATFPPFTFVG